MRRCHDCNARFVQIGGSLIRAKDLHRIFQKIGIALIMAGAAFLVLLVILWFSRAQARNSSDSGALRPTRSTGALYDA